MGALFDVVLHLDQHLFALTAAHGAWVYTLLFLIVFAETGLVITPVLPGDSLLFAAGALCAAGLLNPVVMAGVLLSAAVLGDAVNYAVGRSVGPRVFTATDRETRLGRLLNRERLAGAHRFFERHGGKALVLARFTPVLRNGVPFVAGAAAMSYPAFAFYNVMSAVVWVVSCFGLGYVVGHVPIVREHFWGVALVILAALAVPLLMELGRRRLRRGGETAVGVAPDARGSA